MRANSFGAAFAICAAVGLAQVSGLRAQDKSFHQMEILNGTVRTVHYFLDNATPAEAAELRWREQTENDVALAGELSALRRQYVNDERFMENRRTNVQQLLYGYSTEYAVSLYPGWNYGWGGGWYGYPFGFGYGYPGFYGNMAGTAAHSLAFGVGDEGRIKTEMAHTLAGQATPAFAQEAYQALQRPFASPRLSKIFGTPAEPEKKKQ
jgi:hypothetical protein